MNTYQNHRHGAQRQRGFSLLEAMIALVVMSFGLLALAGMQLSLSRNADVAKQRTEAMRLGQARIEYMRSFTDIDSGTIYWNALDSIANQTVTTNTTYTVSSSMSGVDTSAMRAAQVTVSWTDRAGENQSVVMSTVLSQTDPRDPGFLGNPLPNNTPLKRPKNRYINIPIPALDLNDGTSSYQFSSTYVIVFSNISGNVVKICNPNQANATAAQILASTCTSINGYIVSGYLYRASNSLTWPTGMYTTNISRNTAGTDPITCNYGDAVNQNTNAAIANYKYYICVVPLNTPFMWGGTMRVGGVLTTNNYIICRFEYTQTAVDVNERNIQPYVNVSKSIDQQNYLMTTTTDATPTDSSCPSTMTVTNVSTRRLHQNCKSTNASRATDCP